MHFKNNPHENAWLERKNRRSNYSRVRKPNVKTIFTKTKIYKNFGINLSGRTPIGPVGNLLEVTTGEIAERTSEKSFEGNPGIIARIFSELSL